jgi:hypothetical protein
MLLFTMTPRRRNLHYLYPPCGRFVAALSRKFAGIKVSTRPRCAIFLCTTPKLQLLPVDCARVGRSMARESVYRL